jgi:hypothetical protein
MFLLSQALGAVALTLSTVSLQFKNKTKLLFLQVLTSLMQISSLALVGGMSGAYLMGVASMRKIWFFKNSRKNIKNKSNSLIFFLTFGFAVAIITWQGAISLLPLCAVSCSTIGLWQDDIYILRYLTLIATICLTIYSISVLAYTNALSEIFIGTSTIVSLVRFSLQDRKQKRIVKQEALMQEATM